MADSSSYRHIAPGPSPPSDGGSPSRESFTGSSSQWKKRVSTACLACKKSKRKCSGIPPCDNCRAFNRVCVFDESLDQRRRVAAKRTVDELNYHRDLLNDLFKVVRSEDETHARRLLDFIRADASSDQIRSYIDDTLSSITLSDRNNVDDTATKSGMREQHHQQHHHHHEHEQHQRRPSRDTVNRLQDLRQLISMEGTNPSFRRKVMDIHYLCDDAPFKVPARPWTSVTADDDLVSHLISLYFTWDYPIYSFLDCDVFIRHMASGNLESDFCSPFLVNAVLANACHFSEFSEAYVVPGDLMTKGTDFLSEAERYRDVDESKGVTLPLLQGTLLLYERYSMSKNDDLGYIMLHRAIKMGETLGLIGDRDQRSSKPNLSSDERKSEDMMISMQRTAWGLYQIDTIVHTGFLRRSLINRVNVSSYRKNNKTDDNALWTPYPSHRAARPSHLSQYFEHSRGLSDIARNISWNFFSDEPRTHTASNTTEMGFRRRLTREDLFESLRIWDDRLPATFDPSQNPPPYIILLRMRYHTLAINLFSTSIREKEEEERKGEEEEEGKNTSTEHTTAGRLSVIPTTPESEDSTPKYNAPEITLASARSISHLARLHRREYGMGRAHHFALYAINLALFAMLEDKSFDVLDHDFLCLSSAFSIVASRSPLGRNLFHIFRQSVRAKHQGHRVRESTTIPEDLKELFDEEAAPRTKWDEYAEGLQKLDEDDRYHGLGLEDDSHGSNLQEIPGLGLFDMLDRYESLSLGKDEMIQERTKLDWGRGEEFM